MQLTRRGWGIVATGVVLGVLSVVFAQPRLLIGAVGVGGWLLARQYRFVRALSATMDDLAIEQTLTQDRIVAERETTVTLSVALATPSLLDISVELVPPASATGTTHDDRTTNLSVGDTEVSVVATVEWSVAGSYEFAAPSLTLTDRLGLFRESLARGPTASILVEPRGPTNVHVGEGGDQLMVAYGERQSGRRDAGLDPGELREYVPGDAAGRIDWKATARMSEPYVREYEVETDRVTALLVDHRTTMNEGPTGETKFDYARQVALTFVDSVREFNDPLGYYTVGDDGTTERQQPTNNQYALIKRRLRNLNPTEANNDDHAERHEIASPGAARHAAGQLDGTTAFETTLRPYFATATTYVERIEDDPLFETARAMHARLSGTVWTVLFTDDTHRAEVRETVKLARRSGSRVLVFLTPSVLFEPGGLADLEAAYERYRSFESFRRELARLEGVSAFEVGPGDRLDAVLSSGRRRSSTATP